MLSILIIFLTLLPSYSVMMTKAEFENDVYTNSSLVFQQIYLGSRLQYNNSTQALIFKCAVLFSPSTDALKPIWPPPKQIPSKFLPSFTFNGIITQREWFKPEKQHQGEGYNWTESFVNNLGNHMICYNNKVCERTMDTYKSIIENATGIVFGSQYPWAEGLLIRKGAKTIITVEYMKIVSTHPKLLTYTPNEIDKLFVSGHWAPVDFIFTYSSVEHDGLGRYGDPINPFADLEAIARMHCLLKPGGILFLGIPVGIDAIVYHAHRIYGKYRLKLILGNWELVNIIGYNKHLNRCPVGLWAYQPIIVLRKKDFFIDK